MSTGSFNRKVVSPAEMSLERREKEERGVE